MKELEIRYLNGEGPVTIEMVNELLSDIKNGSCRTAYLSLDEYGEEDFLSLDIENGWAALAYNTWDEDGVAHMFQPINPVFKESDELAPVFIGGQTEVRKRNALNDTELIAESVLLFAKTGKLNPEIKWEEAD